MDHYSVDESISPVLPPAPTPWGPRRSEVLENEMQSYGCHSASISKSSSSSSRRSSPSSSSINPPTLITDVAREDGRAAFAEAQRLLATGADPNARCPVYGFTPLIAAVWRKDRFLVDLLISHPACDVNRVGVGGMTPLMYAALGSRSTTATTSKSNSRNRDLLHAGGSRGHDAGDRFEDRSKEQGNRLKYGENADNYAGNEENDDEEEDLVAVLLRAPGCDRSLFNDNGHNAYDLAFASGHSEACVLLRYDPAVQSAPLLAAQGHCEAIEALVRQGVPPNGPLQPTLYSPTTSSPLVPYSPPYQSVLLSSPTAQPLNEPPHPLPKSSVVEQLPPNDAFYSSAPSPPRDSSCHRTETEIAFPQKGSNAPMQRSQQPAAVSSTSTAPHRFHSPTSSSVSSSGASPAPTPSSPANKHSPSLQITPPSSSSSRLSSSSSQPSLDLLRKHLGQSSMSSDSSSSHRSSIAKSSNGSRSSFSTPNSHNRTTSLTPGSSTNSSSGVKCPLGDNDALPHSSSPGTPRVLFRDDHQGTGSGMEAKQARQGKEGDNASKVHSEATATNSAHFSPSFNPSNNSINSQNNSPSPSNGSNNSSHSSRTSTPSSSNSSKSPGVIRRRVSTSQTRPGERSPPHLRARSPMRPTAALRAYTTTSPSSPVAHLPRGPTTAFSSSSSSSPGALAATTAAAAVAVPSLSPGNSPAPNANPRPSPGFSPGSVPQDATNQHQNRQLPLPPTSSSPISLGPRSRRDLHTPLMAAAAHRRPAVVELLLKYMKSQATHAAAAAAASSGGIVSPSDMSSPSWPLLPFQDDSDSSAGKISTSHPAITRGERGAALSAASFVTSGHDINYQNPKGGTALHYAAASGSERVVLLLLMAGADRHLQDRRGLTPLQWALRRLHDLENEGSDKRALSNRKNRSPQKNGRPSTHVNQRKGIAQSPTTRTPPKVNPATTKTTTGGGRGAAAVAERDHVVLTAPRGSPNGDLNGSLLPEYIPSPVPPQAARHSREQEEGSSYNNVDEEDEEEEDVNEDDDDSSEESESESEARSAKVEACEALWRVIDVMRSDPQAGQGPLALAKATPRHKRHHSSGFSAANKSDSTKKISGSSNASNDSESSGNSNLAEKGHGALQWAAAVGDRGAIVALVKQGVNINLVTPGLRAETALAAAALGLSALISTNHTMSLSGSSPASTRSNVTAEDGSFSPSRSTAGDRSSISSSGGGNSISHNITPAGRSAEQRSPSRSPTKGSSSSTKAISPGAANSNLGIGVPGRDDFNRSRSKSTNGSWKALPPRATAVASTNRSVRAAVVASAVHSEMAALAALQLLLDHPKCNLEQRDSQGYTPLMLASTYGQEASVIALLNAGADRFATLEQHERGSRGASSSTTDARALAISHGHLFLANAVLNADPLRISLPLACYRGDLPIVEGLLRQLRHPTMVNAPGFFFDYDTVEIDNEDSTVTADAQIDNADERDFFDDDDQGELGCYRGNRIVDAPSVDKDNHATEGADQESAIARDQLNESDVLFTSPREKQHHQDDIREHEEDERPNQEAASVSEGSHCYPLQYHRHQHRRKSMRDPSCGFERLVATPLVAAVCNGQLRIVQRLLELPHLEVDQPNPEGETALMLASALPHLHQSMWPLLLRAGADPHGPVDCQGTNAMTWALREQGFGAMLALLAAHAAATAANALSPPLDEEHHRLRVDRESSSKEKMKKGQRRKAQRLPVPPYPTLPPIPPLRPRPLRSPRPSPSTSRPKKLRPSSSPATATAATSNNQNGATSVAAANSGIGERAGAVKSNDENNDFSSSNATRISDQERSRRPLARPAPRSPRMGKSPSSSSSDGWIPCDMPLRTEVASTPNTRSSPVHGHSSGSSAISHSDNVDNSAAAAAKSHGLAADFLAAPVHPSTVVVAAASAASESAMPWPEEEDVIDTEPAASQPESPTLPVACQAPSSSSSLSSSLPPLLPLQPPPLASTTIPAISAAGLRSNNKENGEEAITTTTVFSGHPSTKKTLELVALLQDASIASEKDSEDGATSASPVDILDDPSADDTLAVVLGEDVDHDHDDDVIRLRDACSLPRQPLRWPSEDSALLAPAPSPSQLSPEASTAGTNATTETSTAAVANATAAVNSSAVRIATTVADYIPQDNSVKKSVPTSEDYIFEKDVVQQETSPFLLTLAAALTVTPRQQLPSPPAANHTISGDQHDLISTEIESDPSSSPVGAATAVAASTGASSLSASSSGSSLSDKDSLHKPAAENTNLISEDAMAESNELSMEFSAAEKVNERDNCQAAAEEVITFDSATSGEKESADHEEHLVYADDNTISVDKHRSSKISSNLSSSSEHARGSTRVGSVDSSFALRWPSEDRVVLGSNHRQSSPPPLILAPSRLSRISASTLLAVEDNSGGGGLARSISSEEHQEIDNNTLTSPSAPSPFLSTLMHLSGAPPSPSLPAATSERSSNPTDAADFDGDITSSSNSESSSLIASGKEISDEIVDSSAQKVGPGTNNALDATNGGPNTSNSTDCSNNSTSTSSNSAISNYQHYLKTTTSRRSAFASDVAIGPDPRLSTLRRLQRTAELTADPEPTIVSTATATAAEPARTPPLTTAPPSAPGPVPESDAPPTAPALAPAVAVPIATSTSESLANSDIPGEVASDAFDKPLSKETTQRPIHVKVTVPPRVKAPVSTTSAAPSAPALVASTPIPASEAVEPSAVPSSSARQQLPSKPPSARILRRRAVSAAVTPNSTSSTSTRAAGPPAPAAGLREAMPATEVADASVAATAAATTVGAVSAVKDVPVNESRRMAESTVPSVPVPRKVLLSKRGVTSFPKNAKTEAAASIEARNPRRPTPPRSSSIELKNDTSINTHSNSVSRNSRVRISASSSSSSGDIPRLELNRFPAPPTSSTSSPPSPLSSSSLSSSSSSSSRQVHTVNAAPIQPVHPTIRPVVQHSRAVSADVEAVPSLSPSKQTIEVEGRSATGDAPPDTSSDGDAQLAYPRSPGSSKGLKSTNHGLW